MQNRQVTILACDDVPEPDRSRHGDVHEQVSRHLLEVAPLAGFRLDIDVVDARAQALPDRSHRADLYVLTGSAAEPFSSEPWICRLRDWVTVAVEEGRRMFGICFGHQVIAHALGGQTARARDWEVGVVSMRQRFELLPGGEIGRLQRTSSDDAQHWSLLMSHQDEVQALPGGVLHWLEGAFCRQQGMVLPGQVVTMQGHPEYRTAQVCDLYERRRATLGEQRTDAAQKSAQRPHDGVPLTVAALRHLLDS